jgi:aerobic carbon-monoxide dehydrogenase large subunit
LAITAHDARETRTPLGAPVPRLEDADLVTGRARFTADHRPPGLAYAAFARSPVAHARIRGIGTGRARAADGVLAVFSAADLGLPPMALPQTTFTVSGDVARPPLARETVRFAGDPLAIVVARSPRQAATGASLVAPDLAPLPCVRGFDGAEPDAGALLFPGLGSNVVVDSVFEAGEHAQEPGSVRVRTTVEMPRVAVMPMEPAAILVRPGPGATDVVLSTQMPHRFRDLTAAALGIDPAALRVRCPAVGGGFGGKPPLDTDYVAVLAAALRLDRPVLWAQSRHENLLCMQGRGHRFAVELTAGPTGKVTSMSVDALTDAGAYPGIGMSPTHTARSLATGCYDIGHLRHRIRCVAGNAAPTGAFRGAGRPEATLAVERAMDELAAALGTDPVDLRRRNLVPPGRFPYVNAAGERYDSGAYERALDLALELSGYRRLRAEQAARAGGSRYLLGLGVACYVEVSASAAIGLDTEMASATVLPDGTIELAVGTAAHGQGHWTVYGQVAAAVLGVSPARVRLAPADTARTATGQGTGGSRSGQVGGSAVHLACTELLRRVKETAAALTGSGAAQVEVVPDVGLACAGVTFGWPQIATWPGHTAEATFRQPDGTAPFGCHVAAVEIDRGTGAVRVRRFVAVDDCGTVVNPLVVTGQVHGGVGAGLAETLFEEAAYDADGLPATASLAEYAMPSAADLPSITTAHTVTPATTNPLGAKGVGESGTTGSVAAVANAVADALRRAGAPGVDMPFTPGKVWEALRAAGAALEE